MALTLKQEIETWVEALGHYDNNEFEAALVEFDKISDTSKILFNCGVIFATLGVHNRAIASYQRAIRLDQYLAVAYFQQGVSNFLLGDFEEALANFNDTLLYLRGNRHIDYEQLGLKFKLYSCEVLFNRGLCYVYLQQKEAGMNDFTFAAKEKQIEDHDVINDAIREEADGYTVFSIPVGVVYRPNSAKVKNLKTKDYLGKARLVASADRNNGFTGFVGPELKKSLEKENVGKDDRPVEEISYASSNLVRTDLRSRTATRQQSEPPLNRSIFPPSPPPDTEKPLASVTSTTSSPGASAPSLSSRAASVRNKLEHRPAKLDMQKIKGTMPSKQPVVAAPASEKPRPGTIRTASEPRGPSRPQQNYTRGNEYRTRNERSTPPQQPQRSRSAIREEDRDMHDSENGSLRPDQVVDMYRNTMRPGSYARHPDYIEEELLEEEEEGEETDIVDPPSSFDANEFEMLSGGRSQPSLRRPSRTGSKRPEVHHVRVKVHVDEDTRYMIIGTSIRFSDFTERIRAKFDLRGRFRCKMYDEGDMITMGDQDDLDVAVTSCTNAAKQERSDMGKLDVWIQMM